MTENSLVIFTRAALMLAEADTIQKAKELKTLALTAGEWAKRKGMGEQAIKHCRSYALEAQRKMGEMLAQTERAPRPAGPGRGKVGDKALPTLPDAPPTLAALGLSKRESAEAQRLAAMPREVFDELRDGKKTKAAINREILQASRRKMVANIVEGKFAVILADPPWKYQNSGFEEAAESHYPTMTTDAICNMSEQVKGWSTSGTVLFLWATNPMLLDAFRVLDCWGFTYKTNMAWIKDKGRGKGWFLKSRHELLLIGVKEQTPQPLERPDSAFEAARPEKHSQKPELAYKLIESMYAGPHLEMFSRANRAGWKAFGNEC